jgi:cell division protein FtsI/penicillin-binding protein 2
VKEALAGLSASVNDARGTGHHLAMGERREPHFNVPGVQVWGKTGTATAPTIYVREEMDDPTTKGAKVHNPLWESAVEGPAIAEADGPKSTFKAPAGTRVIRWGDHSWFVVLVGKQGEDRPRYAIAVMMEYAGSGGKVSGPIVNQIIWALRAEGYL